MTPLAKAILLTELRDLRNSPRGQHEVAVLSSRAERVGGFIFALLAADQIDHEGFRNLSEMARNCWTCRFQEFCKSILEAA